MKITNIEQNKNIYTVTFTPGIIGKLFFMREKTVQYKDIGETYMLGGDHVYVDKNGERLGIFDPIQEKLTAFRNRF